MTYNKEQILNLFDGYNFKINAFGSTVFTEHDNNSLNAFLHHKGYKNFSIFYGASKCVIVPFDEDYVIKIPYTGEYLEAEEDYDVSEVYEAFFGAEEDEGWDYCLVESIRYSITKAFHLEKFFAETKLLGHTKQNHPIYIQPKCDVFHTSKLQVTAEEIQVTRTILSSPDSPIPCDFPVAWMTSFRLIYGMDNLIKLTSFIEEYEWDDFRGENVGFLNGKPVIIDYSNFEG